jgi:hypothetical protein
MKAIFVMIFFVLCFHNPIYAQDWTQVNADGFGDPINTIATGFTIYSDRLYVGTGNEATGAEVWRYYDTLWTQVNIDGFGDANNIEAFYMAVYENYLYVGTTNEATGAEVWRYDGSIWTQVNIDGFGDANNWEADGLAVYDNICMQEQQTKPQALKYGAMTV